MKSYNNLYEQVYDFSNILIAYKKALKGAGGKKILCRIFF